MDLTAGNVIHGLGKIIYKQGKGDPEGFISCYVGNRLHVLFHLTGMFYSLQSMIGILG